MPYKVRKTKSGATMSYTDKKGKKHLSHHASATKAKKQIAAIEMHKENDDDPGDTLQEDLMVTILEEILCL